MSTPSRRSFLTTVPALLTPAFLSARRAQAAPTRSPSALSASYPTGDPDVTQEVVRVSHFDLPRLTTLVTRQPALARAAWDWGFGDWEDALGAASHVGRRDIAEFLLAHGARPSIFSAAMFGQLEVVKAFVTVSPGIQRTKGPHGITLLAHAVHGGAQAKPVADYLTTLGDADPQPAAEPLSAAAAAALAGTYEFGPGAGERIDIAVDKGQLTFTRSGRTTRNLTHVGALAFVPAGADAVRVRFDQSAATTVLTILDPDVVLTARRSLARRV